MDYHGAIRRYYLAYRDRDRESLQSLLTPNFHFEGEPIAEIEVFLGRSVRRPAATEGEGGN